MSFLSYSANIGDTRSGAVDAGFANGTQPIPFNLTPDYLGISTRGVNDNNNDPSQYVSYHLLTTLEKSGGSTPSSAFGAECYATGSNVSIWGGTISASTSVGTSSTGSAQALELGIRNQGGWPNTFGLVIVGDGALSGLASHNSVAIQIQVQRSFPSTTGQFAKGIVFNTSPQEPIMSTGSIIECSEGTYRNGIDFGTCNFSAGYVLNSAAFGLENAGAIDFKKQSVVGSAGGSAGYFTVKVGGANYKVQVFGL